MTTDQEHDQSASRPPTERARRQLRGLLAEVTWYAENVMDRPEAEQSALMRDRYGTGCPPHVRPDRAGCDDCYHGRTHTH